MKYLQVMQKEITKMSYTYTTEIQEYDKLLKEYMAWIHD